MELISWSLNTIDTIFSTKTEGAGDPSCPDGTTAAGYVMDGRGKWRALLCLSRLSVEDVEDVYIFGFMMTGLLLIGLCCGLSFWKIKKTAAIKDVKEVTVFSKQGIKAVEDRIVVLDRKMDNMIGVTVDLGRRMETIRERVNAAFV